MKERAAGLRGQAKRDKGAAKAEGEPQDVLDAIAKMSDDDRASGELKHATVIAAAPHLAPRSC